MKFRVLNFIFIFLLLFFCSCNNNSNIEVKNEYENSIFIMSDKTNSILDEVIIKNRNYFYLSDLPKYDNEEHYFLGYSLKNDNDYIEIYDECEIIDDITIYAKFGISKNIFDVGNIGLVKINAEDDITSKEEYVDCSIQISDSDYKLEETEAKIRLRGNSSLAVDKKSYKIKFDEKYDVFNFGKDKEWALIANYYDPSHLRNFYAYRLANAMDMEYSVQCKFVYVYLNEIELGLYLFVETVKTSGNRVDIEDGYDSSNDEIPFLLELDFKLEENDPNYMDKLDIDFFLLDNTEFNWKTYQFATKYPESFTEEDITPSQYKYIKDYMNNVYSSVRDGTYEDYIDVDSFIDYFIIQELFMNIDMDYSSVFMYKPYQEKLHMGPVWDFDISSGNCDYVDLNKYDPYHKMQEVNSGSYLFNELIKDRKFHYKFINRLKQLEDYIIRDMINSFEENYNTLRPYTQLDNEIWDNLVQKNWVRPEYLSNLTYSEQVVYLKNYLYEHYYWMISNM